MLNFRLFSQFLVQNSFCAVEQPKSNLIKSIQQSDAWDEYHKKIETFFSSFPFESFSDSVIIKILNFEVAIFCKKKLPFYFQNIFQQNFAFDKHSITYSDKRFEKNQIGGRHHGFHQFKKKWILFSESSLQFLRDCKALLLYLDNLYKKMRYQDYLKVRKKVPNGWGLYGTVFTSIAANVNSTKWHKDSKDIFWTILIYGGNFEKGELLIGTLPLCKLEVQSFDIVFLKAATFFHTALPFEGERFSLSFYSEEITENMQESLQKDVNKEFY